MKPTLALCILPLLLTSTAAQVAELDRLTGDPALGAQFGSAVSIWGNQALISAPYDDELGLSAGAAFLFERRQDGSWTRVAKLLASDGETGDRFGITSVALQADIAVVGVPFDAGAPPAGFGTGSARVFERQNHGGWVESAILETDPLDRIQFGWDVALDGERLLIGAPDERAGPGPFPPQSGAAYVYQRQEDGGWIEQARLVPGDVTSGMKFGGSVALLGKRAVIGARFADGSTSATGAVYVFEEAPDGTWVEMAKLIESPGTSLKVFGLEVALGVDRILVGTGDESSYVFDRDGSGTWLESARLTAGSLPPTGGLSRCFGCAVALDSERLLIGAIREEGGGVYRGVTHAFQRESDGSWTPTARIRASDGADGDQLGLGLALQGDRALVGARLANGTMLQQGAAYVFDLEPLSGDVQSVSTSGGRQALELDAGHLFGGLGYAILGSMNGTQPGMMLPGGLALPLNGGPYLNHTIHFPTRGPLLGARGKLDPSGHAEAAFSLGPVDIALAGLTLNHAFVVFDDSRGVTFVSNALSVQLVAPALRSAPRIQAAGR